MTNLALLSAGALLMGLYLLLRKEKNRADQALARGTGRVWFEVKVIVVLILLVCLLPRSSYLSELWNEWGYYAYSDVAPKAASSGVAEVLLSDLVGTQIDQGVTYYYARTPGEAVTFFANEGGWLLREYLTTLAQYPIPLLMIFWGFYLLLNDWRHNKKSWRHGIFGLLAARELKYPVQKRLSRIAGIIALAFVCILLSAPCLAVISIMYYGREPLWWSLAGVCVAALVLMAWALKRQQSIWLDVGTLSDQVARLRAGQMDIPLQRPANHDYQRLRRQTGHHHRGRLVHRQHYLPAEQLT